MGCFESKNNKNKHKAYKITETHLGQFNTKWQKLILNDIVSQFIVDDIQDTAEHPAYRAIDKDVSRTFPNHQFFNKQSNIQLFKQTLKCLALTIPKVGYTQGLNFLAGYFLLNKMNKIECLTILTSALTHPSLMFLGLYEDGFPLANLYCELFWKILKRVDKQLYDCLKLIGYSDHMWIFQWYLTFYLYSFPLQYISLFFNTAFQFKDFEMVKISVGIVLCLKEDIINLPEKDDVCLIQYLQNLKNLETCKNMLNPETAIKKARNIQNGLVQESLKQIKNNKKIQNFYLDYFLAKKNQKKNLYDKFIERITNMKAELSTSKHDEKMMMQSYKRNRETVEILDQILLQSIKRQMNKKYKSSLLETRKKKSAEHNQARRWKSLANLEEQSSQEVEGQTTVSVVNKMMIPQENQEELKNGNI